MPWRAASRPMLRSATIPEEDPQRCAMQTALRDYLRAREQAVALRALALETGDAVG